ncbi:hypothetical protein [Streptomyces sp. C10]|uniref:hypothetical protein n=1 Tax=Streptomyces sp. C10 TaxID=531941 RepID=UPI00397EEB9F
MAFRKQGQAAIQVLDLLGELPDSLGQQAQGSAGGLQHRLFAALVVLAVVSEPCAGTQEFRIVQPSQFFPQVRVGTNKDSLELVGRLGAGLDCRALGEFVHPGYLHRSIAGLGPGACPPAQHRPGRVLGIERVRLAALTAVGPVGPVHVEHFHALGQQVAGEGCSEGAGALPPARRTLPKPLAH